MASKTASRLRAVKKSVAKVNHGNYMATNIPAGMALAGPPLGPMLGQRGINISQFCKDFNERTKDYKEGIPLPCRITVQPDRSYLLVIHNPPITYFLKQAAGLTRGSMYNAKEHAGKITLKHVYEIAKIKSQDPTLDWIPLEEICRSVIKSAYTCGIKVVPSLDAKEYGEFLAERQSVVQQQLKDIEEKRQSKVLRTV